MTDTAGDTITIEQTVRIAASAETIWTFWTEPQRLAEWWGTDAEVVAVAGWHVSRGDGERPGDARDLHRARPAAPARLHLRLGAERARRAAGPPDRPAWR